MAQRVVGDRPAEVTKPIAISRYDPSWPAYYRREEARIRAVLGVRALKASVIVEILKRAGLR